MPTFSATTTPATALTEPEPASRQPDQAVTRDLPVLGGLPIDRFAPDTPGPWPVVVTFHGGSWLSGQKEDMEPFARALARRGLLVYNAGYRPLDQGGDFPAMVEDVACAVAAAEADAAATGGPGDVTVLGFSAGAHLAAIVALAPGEFTGPCAGAIDHIESLVGISGPYDSNQFPFLALQFGGLAREVPEAWAAGNPYSYIGGNPDLEVLLVHGQEDVVVDPIFSTDFAGALRSAGYSVQLEMFPGVGHFSIVDPAENGTPTADAVAAFVLSTARTP